MNLRQVRVFISGQVQGVSFRASTQSEAHRFPDLNGWVRNLPDGRVEALFSGPSDAVMAMVEWAKQGPPMAKVVQVEEKEETVDPSLPKFKTKRE